MGWDEPGAGGRRLSYLSGGLTEREQGTVVKDWGGRYPFALVYPNRYHIGMSNLGCQVIYGLVNALKDYVCERVFWEGEADPLYALESRRPLTDFACLGFSFSYELDYLNLPAILRKAGIPLYATERDASHPVVIAGGPCMSANPAPVAPFMDAVAIGEAEALLPDMLPVLSSEASREEILTRLAAIPGVLVPARQNGQPPVQRRWLANLDTCPAHSVVLTPDTELGDLFLLEVERGCDWNCRFCLVSHNTCPIRFHSLASLLDQAAAGLKVRSRIGLVGPVVTDHPQIQELLRGLLDLGAGFSLSSLRLSSLTPALLELIIAGGAESLAIAPEAGSERLRRRIKKGFSEKDILGAVALVGCYPFKRLKLYFMLGLPGETGADIDAIVGLSLACLALLAGTGVRVSVNAAPFVPKAGTPFQWLGMAPLPVLEQRIKQLQDGLRGKGVEVKTESPEWSLVQGALSRGDEKFAPVLASLERPSLAGWRRAVKKCGLSLEHYTESNWQSGEKLPWDSLVPARGTERLLAELAKATKLSSG